MTDVNPRPQRPLPPAPIRWAGIIAIVQSTIVLVFAVLLVARDIMGAREADLISDSANINWVGTGTAVFLGLIFGAAIFAAIWMMRGHQWGRGLVIYLEIITLGLSYFMFTGGLWPVGILTAASALAGLYFLFNRRSLEWAEARHGF